MSLYKRYETSPKLSSKGAPIKFEANEDGTIPTFFIARSHNSNQLFAKAVSVHYAKGTENMSEEELVEANLNIFLEGTLMGWENVLDRNDKPLPFTKANAHELLTDLPDIYERLRMQSHTLANYLKSAEEKAVKNS